MNVLHLHPASDTAGQSMAGKRVLEAAGDSVRVFVRNQHPFGYSTAPIWDEDEVRESYAWADVVIIHNDPAIYWTESRKPVIVHHHGSRFRGDPVNMWARAEAIGARQIVSTIDLMLSVPPGKRAEWMPQVIDTELMAEVRATHRRPDGSRPRVVHAPTNRQIKGTRWVIRAMRKLKTDADFLLIQRQPWSVCLMWKATGDIFVDQLNLGYGNNAIEAWAMGLPVLAGATPDILERMQQEYPLPFFVTSPALLQGDIRAFIESPELRQVWAERGQSHVERFHAPDAWVERTRRIYAGDPLEMVAA